MQKTSQLLQQKPQDIFSSSQIESLKEEARLSFFGLWNESQTDKDSPAYGLVFDRYPNPRHMASIASVGFLLGCLPVAVQEGWVSAREARERAEGILSTLLKLEHFSGFFYHFIDMRSGMHYANCEVSVIDTALLIAGVITAGEYFLGEVKAKADELYHRINWNFYSYTEPDGRVFFRMGFHPENAVKDGKFIHDFYHYGIKINKGADAGNRPDSDGFFGGWWGSSEQLMMYIMGAGTPIKEHRIPKRMYYDFARPIGKYKDGPEFIYSWVGSIFVHQFSHAFVDFRNTVDELGTDWFDNSVKATHAAKYFITDIQDEFEAFGVNAWGLTACDTPTGYRGDQGSEPSEAGITQKITGTVPPCGALGSMPFAPKEVMAAFEHYKTIEGLSSPYGLLDAFNIKDGKTWIGKHILGIDKGISVLMIMNYLSDGIVWNNFMKNSGVKDGMDVLGIRKKEAISEQTAG